MLIALIVPILLIALFYFGVLTRAIIARKSKPMLEATALGAVTNFFDTLGIGSFAPTMAWFKFRHMVDDRLIPCTMLVGYTPPTIVQAIVFLVLLGASVDGVLLFGCILALVMGAVIGAPIAARARVWVVQIVVSSALLLAAALYAMTNLALMPGGGTASSLPTTQMIIAIAANFGFGVLLNFGIGNYAPTLVLLSLMGMDPRLCFPIMAAGGALAAASASFRHIGYGKVDLRIAGGLAIGAIPAVFFAAFVVKSMPITLLRWLVVAVVLYAAIVIMKEAIAGFGKAAQPVEDRAKAL